VRVMLESGITLEDMLYTLRRKVDFRAYPGNRAVASWSEHGLVVAVAEQYAEGHATFSGRTQTAMLQSGNGTQVTQSAGGSNVNAD